MDLCKYLMSKNPHQYKCTHFLQFSNTLAYWSNYMSSWPLYQGNHCYCLLCIMQLLLFQKAIKLSNQSFIVISDNALIFGSISVSAIILFAAFCACHPSP